MECWPRNINRKRRQQIAAAVRPLSYAETILALSPEAWWRLGDAVGSATAADSSGNGNNGTITGAITFGIDGAIVGDADTAAHFNGSTRVSAPSLDLETVSVEAWVRFTTTVAGAICEKWDQTNPRYPYTLRVNGNGAGTLLFGCYDGVHNPFVSAPGPYNDGDWHHVVGVRTAAGGNLLIYVDGAFIATTPDTTTTTTLNGEHVNLGMRGNGSIPYTGDSDEIAIYPFVLTADQIANNHNRGLGL